MSKMVFCFGSNLAGVHMAGAARYAMHHEGAVYGQGIGPFGNSYAIPTKDHNIRTLLLNTIESYVGIFLIYAHEHPELQFKVTRIGCGLAGFKDEQIAPMFIHAPDNCFFDKVWSPYLENEFKSYNYWGTM